MRPTSGISHTLDIASVRASIIFDSLTAGVGRHYANTSDVITSVRRYAVVDSECAGAINVARARFGRTSAPTSAARYRPPAAEVALRNQTLVHPEDTILYRRRPLRPNGEPFSVYDLGPDESRFFYKPYRGEKHLRVGIPAEPGSLARREVAAYRLDQLLGFNRVPPTALIDGPYGMGSVQQWVRSTDGTEIVSYSKLQRQQMAVLDYVMANTDRHWDNYRTGPNGEVVAIDHGLAFPESPDPKAGIRSDFVKSFQGDTLDDDVLRAVDAVDPKELRAALEDLQLSEKSIKGALARLEEIRTNRGITGEEWPDIRRWTKHGPLRSPVAPE